MSNIVLIKFCFHFPVEAIKKVEHIKTKRQNLYLAQRLRKAREVETARDIKAVQRDIAILNDPTEGKILLNLLFLLSLFLLFEVLFSISSSDSFPPLQKYFCNLSVNEYLAIRAQFYSERNL